MTSERGSLIAARTYDAPAPVRRGAEGGDDVAYGALNDDDAAAVLAAIERAEAEGRVIEAVEVHPRRRVAAGPWTLRGVPVISNGLLRVDGFNLKLRGTTFQYDDRDETFS